MTVVPSKNGKKNKSEDDFTPFPNPFPQTALASGKMTKETASAFYSAVASAMLVHKRYPTRDDYILVGRAIIEK